jgi:branched-chain amino acid transport system ATP-binding protein
MLELKNIKVHYNKVEALKGISLEVEEGSITCLLGANGAGKSTTLKTISGLKHPSSGEIWFQGRRIDKLSTSDIVRQGIVQVPEARGLFLSMTVLDNLKTGAYLRNDGGIKRDLDSLFEHFPILRERRGQRAGTLSGGEQQVLAIGRAMMAKPKLLMLDEPSLGLSPIMVGKIISNIIMDINLSGTTILLVEQNARIGINLGKNIYIIQTGIVVLGGTKEQLLDNDMIVRSYLGG